MKELLFLLVLFVSNVIQAITGFAGTVLAMPPSVYLLGLDHAKIGLDNDTFENTRKSMFFEQRTSRYCTKN